MRASADDAPQRDLRLSVSKVAGGGFQITQGLHFKLYWTAVMGWLHKTLPVHICGPVQASQEL